MEDEKKGDLKQRVIEEMVVDHSDALEKNFDIAKQFIRITKTGNVDVLVKDKVNGPTRIMLYLIGKMYAYEAGFAKHNSAGNPELLNELGIPSNSLYPWLKELRDANKIKKIKIEGAVHHTVLLNLIEGTLKEVKEKLS